MENLSAVFTEPQASLDPNSLHIKHKKLSKGKNLQKNLLNFYFRITFGANESKKTNNIVKMKTNVR